MIENSFKIKINEFEKLKSLDYITFKLNEFQLKLCGIYSISLIAEATWAPLMIVKSNFKVNSLTELENIIRFRLSKRKEKLNRILYGE